MLVTNPDHSVTRYFVDPYPALAGTSPGTAMGSPQLAEAPGAALLLATTVAATAVALARRRHRRAQGSGPLRRS